MDLCWVYWRGFDFFTALLIEGMPNALLCAEAVAMLVIGKELPEYFPRSYLVTNERMKNALEDAARAEKGEAVKRVKL
jgi:hypothetical protein